MLQELRRDRPPQAKVSGAPLQTGGVGEGHPGRRGLFPWPPTCEATKAGPAPHPVLWSWPPQPSALVAGQQPAPEPVAGVHGLRPMLGGGRGPQSRMHTRVDAAQVQLCPGFVAAIPGSRLALLRRMPRELRDEHPVGTREDSCCPLRRAAGMSSTIVAGSPPPSTPQSCQETPTPRQVLWSVSLSRQLSEDVSVTLA